MNSDIEIVLIEKKHLQDIIVREQDQYIKDSPSFDQWCEENANSTGYAAIRISDGKILGCGGIKLLKPGIGEPWLILCDEIENYKKDTYDYALRYGTALIKTMGITRLEATVKYDNVPAIKLAESIGFKLQYLKEDGFFLYTMSFPELTVREKVQIIENKIKELPNHMEGDCFPLRHFYAKGLYGREITVPAGALITSKIHKYSHFFFLLKGKIEVLEEGGAKIYSAPKFFITEGGTKRAVSHLEDTVVMTVHATDKTDIKEIEEEIIAKSFAELDSIKEVSI